MNRKERRQQAKLARQSLSSASSSGTTSAQVDAALAEGFQLQQAGRTRDAELLYQKVLRARPDHPDALRLLGVLRLQRREFDEAAALLQRAIDAGGSGAVFHGNLGSALHAAGRHAESVVAFRRAADLEPMNAFTQNNLANALKALGRIEESVAAFRRAVALQPGIAELHANLGSALRDQGSVEAAVSAFQRALALKPQLADVHVNLGSALQVLGRTDEAVATYRRALSIDPQLDTAHGNLAMTLLEKGEPREALEACQACLRVNARNRRALAMKAIALDELGDRAAARALVDFERLVRQVELEAPPGFASMPAFNAALAQHVLAHPTLAYEPFDRTTRRGEQTGELCTEPRGPIAALETLIRRAADAYFAALPVDAAHPYLNWRPKKLRLTVWGTVLQAQGHQLPHFHPSAWLSGVCYVQIPDVIRQGGASTAGWIEFGRAPSTFRCTRDPEVKLCAPAEGRMFLFPSYFYHRTLPFESTVKRISIAFDLSPEE